MVLARESPAPVKVSSECDKLAIMKDNLSLNGERTYFGTVFFIGETDHINSNSTSPCTRKSEVPQICT